MSTLCNVFWRFDLVLISALDGEIRPSPLRTFRFPKCQLDECCSLDPSAALVSSVFTASNIAATATKFGLTVVALMWIRALGVVFFLSNLVHPRLRYISDVEYLRARFICLVGINPSRHVSA